MRARGRSALITGAGSGIGLATAERLLSEGYRLALGRFASAPGLDALLRGARGGGPQPLVEELDVRDRAAVAAFVARAEERLGGIDVLVTCAGIHSEAPAAEIDWDDWDEALAVNLTGTFACIRAAIPGMLARGSGRIITVGSELALTGMSGYGAYCASKAGVVGLTKSLARELAPQGILVNCVAPGPTATDMLLNTREGNDPATLEGIPLGRFATPGEIARVVSAMAGDVGDYFVGQVVSPNGGAAI